jgi:hypothetical protein
MESHFTVVICSFYFFCSALLHNDPSDSAASRKRRARPYTNCSPHRRDADSLLKKRNVAGCQLAANELLVVKKARGEEIRAFFTRVELAYESLRAAFCDEIDIDHVHERVGF